MDDNTRRILARLLAVEFSRAYCHSYCHSLRLVRDGVSYDPMAMTVLERATYMMNIYRKCPGLFANLVRRRLPEAEPGTPTHAFLLACEDWCKANVDGYTN